MKDIQVYFKNCSFCIFFIKLDVINLFYVSLIYKYEANYDKKIIMLSSFGAVFIL